MAEMVNKIYESSLQTVLSWQNSPAEREISFSEIMDTGYSCFI